MEQIKPHSFLYKLTLKDTANTTAPVAAVILISVQVSVLVRPCIRKTDTKEKVSGSS